MLGNNEEFDASIEESRKDFLELNKNINVSDLVNEAEIRYKYLDDVIALLGWNKQHGDVSVERYDKNGGRIDYILSQSRSLMIVEAKKSSIDFGLVSTGTPKIVSLGSLMVNNVPLKEAVSQASAYSQSKGIPFTVATNGYQYIIFQGSRNDSISPMDGNAITFGSIEQINQYYIEFWRALSAESVLSGALSDKLANRKKQVPIKVSGLISNYPGNRIRNELQTDLQIVSELILEDLTHDELEDKFIEDCYCESGALSQYSLLAKNIITSKYYQDTGEEIVSLERAKHKEGVNPRLLNDAINHRPVILMGNVGVGKTSFVKNLIRGKSKTIFRDERRIPLYVDLGEKLVMTDNLNAAIVRVIENILRSENNININDKDFVRKVYKSELDDFKSSIYSDLPKNEYKVEEIKYLHNLVSDKQSHLVRSLNYISRSKGAVVIFLDNVDQRSTTDQQNIYLVAQDFAANTSSTVFVSLRPETFYASRDEGVLQAYHQRAFTIEPPRIDEVLSKRLLFGLKLARGELPVSRLEDLGTSKLEGLSDLLVVMERSLTRQGHYRNKELIRFIDNFTAGNVRNAIEMVKDFLSNGHTNSGRILGIERMEDEEYLVSLHEFLKSLIFGENMYYNPEESKINNIFEIINNDPKEYFLRLSTLRILQHLSELEVNNKGFVTTKKLYSSLQDIGFSAEQIDTSLQYSLRNRLIETSANYILRETSSPNLVRITSKAMCYLELVVKHFQYIDAVLIDTPILKKTLMESIAPTYQEVNPHIFTRLRRSALFISYVEEIYGSTLAKTSPDYLTTYWQSVFEELRKEIEKIDNKEKLREAERKKLT